MKIMFQKRFKTKNKKKIRLKEKNFKQRKKSSNLTEEHKIYCKPVKKTIILRTRIHRLKILKNNNHIHNK